MVMLNPLKSSYLCHRCQELRATRADTRRLTHATMYQYPQEFIVDLRPKAAALETDWKE
jgi:hypothetical protein